jgi:hypothetical protein
LLSCFLSACSGGDEFSVAPPQGRTGTIDVVATVTGVECLKIRSYSASPSWHVANSDVFLTSSVAIYPGLIPNFLWSATSGTFTNATSANAMYRCGTETAPTITLTVSSYNCLTNVQFGLDCT